MKYQPYKELILHEIRKVELPDLLTFVISQVEAQRQGGTPSLDWMDGIAFVKGSYPVPVPTKVTEDEIEGRLHYPIVFFAETSYEPQKKATVNGREVAVRLNKVVDNAVFADMVKFLKTFKPSSD